MLRRNYLLHAAEGGIYIGGMAFIAADSVLPAMMLALGAPTGVVALMPTLSAFGFCLPPLFTAHRIEGLRRVFPLVATTGAFQRLPFVLAAAALLWLWPAHPVAAVAVAAVAPLVSGLAGGVSVVGWQELVITTIDPRRVSSLYAVRYLIAGGIGIGAGPVVAAVLHRWPDHRGYAALYGLAALFLLVSYGLFLGIRELDVPKPGRLAKPSLSASLGALPALWRGDARLRALVWVRVLHTGVMAMTPFLAAHALATTGRPASWLGMFVTTQMVGSIVGNLCAGALGDRAGGLAVVNLSRWMLVVTCVLVMAARSLPHFELVFLLYGAAVSANQVGMSALHLEVSPVACRPTYLAVLAAVNAPSLLLAAAAGTALRSLSHGIRLPAAVALVCVLVSFTYLRRLGSVARGGGGAAAQPS